MIGYKNGQFLAVDDLNIPINELGVSRGFGAYDFFGVYSRKAFYLERHLKRLKKTAEILRFNIPHLDELVGVVNQIIDRNAASDFGIKCLAFPRQESNPPFLCDLYVFPVSLIKFDEDEYTDGCHLILREYARFLPEAKSTNYIASQYYKPEMDAVSAVDVLYHDNGFIRETSRGNFFIVKDDVVITPKNRVLKGITQSVLFDLMNNNNITYRVEDIALEQLKSADEIFVTSSTKLVLPIVNIEGAKVADGKVGRLSYLLSDLFAKHKQVICK